MPSEDVQRLHAADEALRCRGRVGAKQLEEFAGAVRMLAATGEPVTARAGG